MPQNGTNGNRPQDSPRTELARSEISPGRRGDAPLHSRVSRSGPSSFIPVIFSESAPASMRDIPFARKALAAAAGSKARLDRAAARASATSHRWRGLVAGALAVFLLANGGVTRDPHTLEFVLTPERLVRNFDTVVFHSEFDERVQARLRKWVAPVRIYLDVRAGDPDVMRVVTEGHVRKLAEITGHDIAITRDRRAANLFVVFERSSKLEQVGSDYFGSRFDIQRVMRKHACSGMYFSSGNHKIFRATIVIATDRVMPSGKLPACIVEELTQVLGLPNDSETVFPSIFNDASIDDELTGQDVLLVRLLYDPRLEPGMPRQEVLRLVRRILAETRPRLRF